MMLNIIDQIYSNSHFTTLLIGAICFLVVLFIIVLYMGIRDAKKSKEPVIVDKEEKDITFDDVPKDNKELEEDVTFEMPTITKNLEDFKKGLEEALQTTPEAPVKVNDEIDDLDNTVLMEAVKDIPQEGESNVEDDFLSLLKTDDREPRIVPVIDEEKPEEDIPLSLEELDQAAKVEETESVDNTREINLPKVNNSNSSNNKEEFNSEERKKRERMLDDYLSATQALSLDAINEKLKEYEEDDF